MALNINGVQTLYVLLLFSQMIPEMNSILCLHSSSMKGETKHYYLFKLSQSYVESVKYDQMALEFLSQYETQPWNRKTTFHQCVFDVVIKKID